jgi:hypothetical protein
MIFFICMIIMIFNYGNIIYLPMKIEKILPLQIKHYDSCLALFYLSRSHTSEFITKTVLTLSEEINKI